MKERLENELCCISLYIYELFSFYNLSVTSPTSQLILQPFRRFTYVTAHSPTLPLLYLRHSPFSNPSFASPTSQALHLIHLASRPWKEPLWGASIPDIDRIPTVAHYVIMTPDLHVLITEKHCPPRRQHTVYTNKRLECKGEVHSSPLNK